MTTNLPMNKKEKEVKTTNVIFIRLKRNKFRKKHICKRCYMKINLNYIP